MTEKQVNSCMAAHHAGEEQPVQCHPALFVCKYCHGMSQNRICPIFFCFMFSNWGFDIWLWSLWLFTWDGSVNDSRQSLDHGTQCPKLDTATSILLRLIPRNNSARAPGKWERKVPFFSLRLRGMWHRVDGFCRIGTPEAHLSYFFQSRNVGQWID